MPITSNKKVKSFYWPDGSGFEFDLPPKDVTGGWDESEVAGGIYDVPELGFDPDFRGYRGWTNWLDKYQKDYRFAALSDSNASANVFPEVQDPWMFTEYVYEGTGTGDDLDQKPADGAAVVEPPLVKPHRVARTFANNAVAKADPEYLNDPHTTLVGFQPRTAFETERRWRSLMPPKKLYWESELDALGWVEVTGGTTNTDFEPTNETRRTVRFQHPSHNAGVRLNRAKVWARATRWGQSQNVPPRVLTHTAPPDYFRAKEMITDRIVPHVNIISGQPIFDIAPQVGGQGAVYFDQLIEGDESGFVNTPDSGFWRAKIGMAAVTPAGTNGVSDAVFTYPVPASIAGLPLAATPVFPSNTKTEPRYRWVSKRWDQGDLVHRGCQFWKGAGGQVQCDHARQFASSYQPLDTTIAPFTSTAAETVLSLGRAVYMPEEEPEVMVGGSATGPWRTATGYTPTPVPDAGSPNTASSVRLARTTATGAGLTHVRVRTFRKDRPLPHATLCATYDGTSKDQRKVYTDKAKAQNVKPCPFFTATGPRILATFEGIASNGSEWANMERGLPPGYKKSAGETAQGQGLLAAGAALGGFGLGIGAGIAWWMAANTMTPDPFINGVDKPVYSTTEITFEPEKVPVAGKQTYYDTADGLPPYSNAEDALRVRAGTGFHTIDWKSEEPYGGTDTVFFGMVNQINYRLMHSVQHCYKPDKCNPIIFGGKPATGWRRGGYSNIDFTAHALRVPGYPAHDYSARYCLHGNHRCPKTNLDRRAAEYNGNYKVLLDEVLSTFRAFGVGGFNGLTEAFIDGGVVKFFSQTDLAGHPDAMCVAVAADGPGLPQVLGHWQPLVKDAGGTAWRVFFYYDRPSWDPSHRQSHVAAHLVHFDGEDRPCYMPVTEPADKAAMKTMFGDETKVPWLVELVDQYVEPAGNTIFATNGLAFAGGRAPEYRDLSKRGRRIMCTIGGYQDTFGNTGSNSNQFGGDPSTRAPVVGQARMSYWTDRDGEAIVEGTAIPDLLPQPPDPIGIMPRIKNNPPVVLGAIPIDGVPSTAVEDPENPDSNRAESDFAAVGHTYSSDTKALIDWFNEDVGGETRWHGMLPDDPNDPDGGKVKVAPPSPVREYLPKERYWYQCDKCGIDYTEEEFNWYRANLTLAPLPANPPQGAQVGCPRRDGGVMVRKAGMAHFPETRARGHVDVWAPPGSTVRRDGFFWKNPTLVSRAHVDQIAQKLGGFHGTGGGYSFNRLNPMVEGMGRMPVVTDGLYNPGLSHQYTAPWAMGGETVAVVRARVADLIGLAATDTSRVHRKAKPTWDDVRPQDEASTQLQTGDFLGFFRLGPDEKPVQIGLTFSTAAPASAQVLNEPAVLADPARPRRADYSADGQGDRLFRVAVRAWMIGVVQDTMYDWGTMANVGAAANPLADQVQALGGPASLGHSLDPKTGLPVLVDERVLAPYGKTDGGGLKMVTVNHLKRLRNNVLPMLAYDITTDRGYSAGGDYTDVAQAGNLKRFQQIKRPLPIKRWGTIPAQVLASNTTGREYYVEWDVDDINGTKGRAYYPVGKTWWRINQKVGQIKRGGGTNPLHLDDAEEVYGIPYTGDVVTSVCAFFLHGRIPMDKEVVRAYAVYQTEDGPNAAAIGCQGIYTGNVGYTDMDGNFGDLEYRGHSDCYWQHYHAWTQPPEHEQDKGAYDGGPSWSGNYWGKKSKDHVDKFGDDYKMEWEFPGSGGFQSPDEGFALDQHGLRGPHLVPMTVDFGGSIKRELYRPWLGEDPQKNYRDHTDILQVSFVDDSYGWDFEQPFLDPWSWGADFKQKLTEHEIWKDIDFGKYDAIRDRYHTVGEAAWNGNESTQSFDYYSREYRDYVWPHEHQQVPGWIDFGRYNSAGDFYRTINVADKYNDSRWAGGPIVIVQANEPTPITEQSGNAERVIDITDSIRKAYNERVTRFYDCKLGWSFADLAVKIPALTDTNLRRADRLHQGQDDPMYFWNYRFVLSGTGVWLSDPWHHTPLVADQPATAGEGGDPIVQTKADRDDRVQYVTGWDTQGLDSTDAQYNKYHPLALCRASQEFTEDSPQISPSPQEDAASYWRVASDRPDGQWFDLDLRQVPIETSRRNWRYQPPQVNSANAICPNVANCMIAQNGWTVAQFYERATSTWGLGIIPSTTSEYCANCGTKMAAKDGVVYFAGDGITTVGYDPPYAQDALITAVQVALGPAADGWEAAARHGLSVEYYNSATRTWRSLFWIDYDEPTARYVWREWSGSAWVERTGTAPPTTFAGREAVGSEFKDKAGASGAHFLAVPAAKLRAKVVRPARVPKSLPAAADQWLACTPSASAGTLTVAGGSAPVPSDFVFRTVTLRRADTQATRAMTITKAEKSGSSVVFTLNGVVDAQETSCRVEWVSHVARLTKFRVFGWPYRPGDLTITPPAYVQPISFGAGNNSFLLNAWPTRILGVEATAGDNPPFQMAESATSRADQGFRWDVKKTTYGPWTYLEVTGGKFFYDFKRRTVIVPTTYLDPDTQEEQSVWAINEALYNDVDKNFSIPTLPNRVTIEYFTGTGLSVEVPVEAHGAGPSYQLDRECVSFIAREGSDDETVPGDVQSNPSQVLPDMGFTTPLSTNDNQKAKLHWQVYNHDPIVWDNSTGKNVGWLVGDELPANGWDDNTVLGVFSGGHGRDMSDLGPGAKLRGVATGAVTLYGMPNAILSGKLAVYAKAYTTRSYHLADGSAVTTAERTGGYRTGCGVFRLGIQASVSDGRKGVMASVPKVLVYLRERNSVPALDRSPLR